MIKKITAVLAAAALAALLAGCKEAPTAIDLAAVDGNIAALGIFPDMLEPTEDYLEDVCGIDMVLVERSYIRIPWISVRASSVWMALPKADATERVRLMLDNSLNNYENQWENYLPDQYELVRDRLFAEIETDEGTWLVFVVSEDNEGVLKAIKDGVVG